MYCFTNSGPTYGFAYFKTLKTLDTEIIHFLLTGRIIHFQVIFLCKIKLNLRRFRIFINFIRNDNDGYIRAKGSQFFVPNGQIFIRRFSRHVKNKNGRVGAVVKTGMKGLETLLSRRVPKVDLHCPDTVDFYILDIFCDCVG